MGSCWAWPLHTSRISPGSCHPAPGPPRADRERPTPPCSRTLEPGRPSRGHRESHLQDNHAAHPSGGQGDWPLAVHPQAQRTEGT